jgi:hypothetical protein
MLLAFYNRFGIYPADGATNSHTAQPVPTLIFGRAGLFREDDWFEFSNLL